MRFVPAFLVCVLVAAPCRALVTDWQIDHVPVFVGDVLTCTALDDGGPEPVNSYSWEIRCVSGDCLTSSTYWAFSAMGPSTGSDMYSIGKFYVRLTVNYGQYDANTPPPPDTVIEHSFTVQPPTGTLIIGGNGQSTPIGQGVWLYFQIVCGPNNTTAVFAGQPQEHVYNYVVLGVPQSFDSGWVPSGFDPQFYMNGSAQIVDMKFVSDDIMTSPFWKAPIGGVVYTRTQDLRVITQDCCGNQVIVPLGSYTVGTYRDSVNTYYTYAAPN
jgi:hypothetical protein